MYKNCNVGSKMFFKWSSMWGKGFCWKQEIFPLKSHVMWFTEISVTWLQVKLVSCCNLTSIGPLFLHNAKVELVLCSTNPPQKFRAFDMLLFCLMLFIWSPVPKIFKLCSNYVRYIHFNSSELEFFFSRLIAGTISSFRIDSTYKR